MAALSNTGRRNWLGGGASVGRPAFEGAATGGTGAGGLTATEASGAPLRELQERDASTSAAEIMRTMRRFHSTHPTPAAVCGRSATHHDLDPS